MHARLDDIGGTAALRSAERSKLPRTNRNRDETEAVVLALQRQAKQIGKSLTPEAASSLATRIIYASVAEKRIETGRGFLRAADRIEAVSIHATALDEALGRLHDEDKFLLAFDEEFWTPLRMLCFRAQHQVVSLRSNRSIPEPERARRGRPRTSAESNLVAQETLDAFETVARKKATVPSKDGIAYGPFLELITEVFKALGITSSPESRARWAVSNRSIGASGRE